MIIYQIITEQGKTIAFFLKKSLAELYCKQGRNLKYEKVQLIYDNVEVFKGEDINERDGGMDNK